MNSRHEQSTLESAVKDLTKTRQRCRSNLIRDTHDLERRLHRATVLSTSGGCPGNINELENV